MFNLPSDASIEVMPASGKLRCGLVKKGDCSAKNPFKNKAKPKIRCGKNAWPEKA